MPDLIAPGDDRVSKALPDHRKEASCRAVPRAAEPRGPADVDHGVARPGEPVDLRHVVEFHSDDCLAGQRKSLRQMTLELRGIGQKTCRNRKPAGTPASIADNAGW